MADRIITVTNPSVVTNDTLAGYNNYSDIDGQLGTTMTPTEATNGKTVTLSDGSVHEVTTKPVGTTNGEFSAVVSEAVTVDLAGATPIIFTTSGLIESPSEVYATESGTSWQQRAVSDIHSGDFDFGVTLDDPTDYRAFCTFITFADNNDSYTSADYGIFCRGTNTTQKIISGALIGTDVGSTPSFTGEILRLVRVGANLKIYQDDTELNDFGTVSTADVYFHIQPKTVAGDKFVKYPRLY